MADPANLYQAYDQLTLKQPGILPSWATGALPHAALLAGAGFGDIRIAPKDASREYIQHWAPGRGVENFIASASIEAIKPLA
jgi:hypothetical protein